MNPQPGNVDRGTIMESYLPDGRITGVVILTLGRGRVVIGRLGNEWWDDMW
jgi:hypothetical protein